MRDPYNPHPAPKPAVAPLRPNTRSRTAIQTPRMCVLVPLPSDRRRRALCTGHRASPDEAAACATRIACGCHADEKHARSTGRWFLAVSLPRCSWMTRTRPVRKSIFTCGSHMRNHWRCRYGSFRFGVFWPVLRKINCRPMGNKYRSKTNPKINKNDYWLLAAGWLPAGWLAGPNFLFLP